MEHFIAVIYVAFGVQGGDFEGVGNCDDKSQKEIKHYQTVNNRPQSPHVSNLYSLTTFKIWNNVLQNLVFWPTMGRGIVLLYSQDGWEIKPSLEWVEKSHLRHQHVLEQKEFKGP